MEISKLSDLEFKIMVIRMFKELTDNYKELSDINTSMKKYIGTINKNQEEMKNTISKIKYNRRGYMQPGQSRRAS